MAVPYTFGTATAAIPLSQLDSNFATAITIGNTAVQLGNTVTTLNNMTLANVTISSGIITITNVAVTTANVSGTANISTLVVTANASVAGNVAVTGNVVVTGNVTSATHILTGGTANGVVYLDTTKALTTGSALVFDGTNFGLTLSQNAATKTTLTNSNAGASASARYEANNGSNTAEFGIRGSAQTTNGVLAPQVAYVYSPSSAGLALVGAAGPILFSAGGTTESMRLDSSGNLLVAGTSAANVNANGGFYVNPNSLSTFTVTSHKSGASSGSPYAYFYYANTDIGSITQNGTTGVLYNLTSDYRLKNDQQTLTGAKDFIMALKPKKWQWWDGSGEGVGFVAHEFMEVAKYSGNGKKDAVDSDGKPVYQSIQPSSSEVMANLVAFIQEQQALITTLTARITALEGA